MKEGAGGCSNVSICAVSSVSSHLFRIAGWFGAKVPRYRLLGSAGDGDVSLTILNAQWSDGGE